MPYIAAQRPNRKYAIPGTCNQTGNKAPRFPWSKSWAAIRVLILEIAYHLDYTDEQMWSQHEWPPMDDMYRLFKRTVPWFPDLYDDYQLAAAKARGYDGPLGLFRDGCGPDKVHNRLRYCFETPGRSGGPSRQYGYSSEHPARTPGKRREILHSSCGEEIMARLKMGKQISKAEMEAWSC